MHKEFEEILSTLNKTIIHLDAKGVQKEFENIPLDIFGRIQIDRPSEYPNIFHWLPQMPSSDIQRSWTGSADHVLMKQSLAFLKTIISAYHAIACKPLGLGNVLDFGCGWGRLIRLLYKYVPADRIYGVDPWLKSIEICKKPTFVLIYFYPNMCPGLYQHQRI
ncbi:MAG: class I SAM-dependent methyltransferase [Nitrospina sp.]|nr:class I SAM-dependent methyltransferase [Nitrospina sp.]